MGRIQARTAILGIVTSKRIAVALCAAVAMVLGAMSVGASYRSNSPSASTSPTLEPPLSAIEETQKPDTSANSTPSPLTKDLSEQHMLTPNIVVISNAKPPLLVSPTTKLTPQVQLNLGTINASVTPQNIDLNVTAPVAGNVDVTVPVPDPTPIIDDVTNAVDQTVPGVNDLLSNTLSGSENPLQN